MSQRIKELRESKRLKQSDIADKLGLEQANYSRIERKGDKLTVKELKEIASAMGMELKELMFNEPNNSELEELRAQLDIEQKTINQTTLQKAYLLDNVLKFILNIDNLLQKPVVKYAIGEVLNPKQKDHQVFVRCYCEVGNEVFTLATWQKPISKEASHFAHLQQNGEHLFNAEQQKEANQYKDAAFANIQQNHSLWTINFINLTEFFRVAFG
ncbi:helix-turn-helix transcriptional regulator [uncultured Microscilla sp.]|uniref:helix-turn-helix domain-containing protein n=1 Tax=uncultured Microscilla sp. TaxID=432653 RepID=UPI002636BCC9|nr:helix-turn-helix transcriptional regulator [uncultured Microscilla sp.]